MPWKANDAVGLERTLPGCRRVAALLQRSFGFLYFWVFLALLFQMNGLIGPDGILPAADFLAAVKNSFPLVQRLPLVPSVLWLSAGTTAIYTLCAVGLAASVLAFLRIYPRLALGVCLAGFLSFLATAQVFASYQSDGMLMTAGLVALFLDAENPSWWSLFSLRWLWFSIYFGSGIAKMLSGEPQWRHLTALDKYYENSPLPTVLGWYAQQRLPHWAEVGMALTILVVELGLAWLCFGPRRWRIVCFWIVTPFQVGIILTANYGFLNYLVLALGFALLDDRHLDWILRRKPAQARPAPAVTVWAARRRVAGSVCLAALFLLSAANLAQRIWPKFPTPRRVNLALEPFRIADPFGLFAVMTRARYEIEFQGTRDGDTWVPYPLRHQPQDPARATGFVAPYQPRFDWNLWFASLETYRDDPWAEQVELRLLNNDPAVLGLFAGNPFEHTPPVAVRAVLWRYWYSTPAEKRQTGAWWVRKQLGLYAPEIARTPRGAAIVQIP
ncbi:MAG TPA: lipase maturation factor family protein [Terriglobales bacterium]|nr:lipase maturation factor family protein [Terriglobales bacterium]